MPTAGITVEGGRQLRASLRKAAGDLQDLKDIHREVGDLVLSAAGPGAPHLSGRLEGSGRAAGTATQSIIRYGGVSVPYAGVQHYGWAAHNIEPHPWVVDAAHSTEPRWTDMFAEGVQRILNRVKGI